MKIIMLVKPGVCPHIKAAGNSNIAIPENTISGVALLATRANRRSDARIPLVRVAAAALGILLFQNRLRLLHHGDIVIAPTLSPVTNPY